MADENAPSPSIEFQLGTDDLVAFYCFGAERAPHRGRKYRGAAVQALVLALMAWGYGYTRTKDLGWIWPGTYFPGLMAGVFLVLFLFFLWLQLRGRRDQSLKKLRYYDGASWVSL